MGDGGCAEAAAPDVTRDAFYGGRLMLAQPARGHRSGTDAVLLAAAVPRDFAGLAYDVGSGVGVAGLGVALAAPSSRVVLVERDPATARLAAENIVANAMAPRVAVACCDLLQPAERRAALRDPADLVVTNPPFYEAAKVRPSPDDGRRAAHVFGPDATLKGWIVACLDLLALKGALILVHAAAAVPEILAALDGRAGGIRLKSVHPREGQPARRVLIWATKASRAPMTIAAPLVLFEGNAFTDTAARLHEGRAGMDW